ncbi:MAG: Ku protein [Wenzhouxiangellaceae bacterium]|nr:Ku protein [Wenzhouxiangellaceae bacterium]
MATGIWSGMLTFGLVTLPVHLVAAVRSRPTALRMLHQADNAPLERRLVNPKTGEMIDRDDQVRGFKVSEDEYVVVSDEELEALSPERSQAIEIERFVGLESASTRSSRFISTGPITWRPTGAPTNPIGCWCGRWSSARTGIANFVIKERQYLVAVVSRQQVLVLVTLHYQRQLVEPEGLAPENPRVDKTRLSAVLETIKDMERRFDPEVYRDDDELALLELAKEKAEKNASRNRQRLSRPARFRAHRRPVKLTERSRALRQKRRDWHSECAIQRPTGY